eukprot:g2475.t1
MYEPAHADGGSTTAVPTASCLRVITTWRDGTEKIEEYTKTTGRLAVRKWRTTDALGRAGRWQFEIGEPASAKTVADSGGSMMMMKSSAKNPTFVPQDSTESWIWRVRNIPYEKSVYQLTVDEEKQQIVLRTTNKKYFKRFDIPAMKRLKMKIDPRAISCKYANSTLVIKHVKPAAIREMEAKQRKSHADSQKKKGDDKGGDCKQQ